MAQCEMGTLCVQVRRRTVWAMRASGFNVHRAQGGPGVGNSASGFMVWPPLPRGYLTFGDIEGKLARRAPRRMHQVRPRGTLQRGEDDREVRPEGQHDEVARDAKRRLSEAGCYGHTTWCTLTCRRCFNGPLTLLLL